MMRRAMINCNQVQTEVISEGRWIEEDPLPNSGKNIVLVIPGNPGVPRFYEGFVKAINSRLSLDIPLWIIGHAGFVQPPKDLDIAMPSDEKWDEFYGLKAQVQHKIEFIKRYIPEDAKLYVIAHSIGAWIVLNMLKDHDIDKRIKKCYLLFPTIEYMAESPNGRFMTHVVKYLAPLLIFLSWIFTTMFPSFLQTLLIRIFGLFYSIPAKYDELVKNIVDPKVLHKMLYLAKEEMKCVKEADHETISKYADKLWFYYGAHDGWTPVKYYKNMKSKHPDLNAQLCQRGFRHAFVLKHDEGMGYVVGDLINEECITDTRH